MHRWLAACFICLAVTSSWAQTSPTPRMVAEWEPALGALIRWPLGIPMDLVVELARDDVLYTLVETAGSEQQARSAFQNAGIDLEQVEFIRGDLWSMWTRDWGPQAIITAQGQLAYADPWFDGYPWVPGCDDGPAIASVVDRRDGRGYEEDDALPAVVAAHLGTPLAPVSAYLTGGNIMTDGLGAAWSTRQMLAENAPHMNEAAFRQHVGEVMGLDRYHIVLAPEVYGIQHIDCYAKLVDEQTVVVKEVPSWHPEAGCCDALAAAFAAQTTAYGRPFDVVRIFCDVYEGQAAAAYTNSLILNRKVLVPMFGIPADQQALATYQEAMPGYQVLGFPYGSWYDYDALHCRTMGLFDPAMVRLLHAPLEPSQPAHTPVTVTATIEDLSGSGLDGTERVLWRLLGETAWNEQPLVPVAPDSFQAVIPAQAAGAQVQYRLEVANLAGRQASLPRGAQPASYLFDVAVALAAAPSAGALRLQAVPNPCNPRTELRLSAPLSAAGVLELYDVRGRRIRTWPLAVGAVGVLWDGCDGAGTPVASGVYVATLAGGPRSASVRVTLGR